MIVLRKKGERERIDLVTFLPDGLPLLTSSYNGTFLWHDLMGTGSRSTLPHLGRVERARITPDGRYLLTAHSTVTVTALADGTSQQIELWERFSCGFDLAADGRHLIVAQNNRGSPAGWVGCRSLGNPTHPIVWSWELERHTRGSVTCVADDRFVLTESWWDQNLLRSVFRYVVRSVTTGEVLTAVEGPEIDWFSPVASPDGQLLVGLLNARVIVLSVEDLSKPAAVLKNSGRRHFTGVAFHPSGKYLAATSNDATVKVYDTTTWELSRTFTWNIGRMRSIAFSPDGTLAVAGGDAGKVVVWDVDL